MAKIEEIEKRKKNLKRKNMIETEMKIKRRIIIKKINNLNQEVVQEVEIRTIELKKKIKKINQDLLHIKNNQKNLQIIIVKEIIQ